MSIFIFDKLYLYNISQKNKHIKRLLRDIESLENQITDQSGRVSGLQSALAEATVTLTKLADQLNASKFTVAEHAATIESLNARNADLENQLSLVEQDKLERDMDIQNFGRQLEERAVQWKNMLEDKDDRLDSLRVKYDRVLDQNPGYDIDSERLELTRLATALKERDELIAELESKIINLSTEMMNSTNFMNNLAKDRESAKQAQLIERRNGCCDDVKALLTKSTERCKELQDMCTQLEEDNVAKAKRVSFFFELSFKMCPMFYLYISKAMEAVEALYAYQSGEDGLTNAVRKNNELQNKLTSRDVHIQALIMELNTMQNTAQENCVLRLDFQCIQLIN